MTSVRNTLKAALWGHEDFAVSDMLNSEYDLQYASKNFRFALTPKVSITLTHSMDCVYVGVCPVGFF